MSQDYWPTIIASEYVDEFMFGCCSRVMGVFITSAVDTTIPATAFPSIISTDATEINLTLYLPDFFLKLGARYRDG